MSRPPGGGLKTFLKGGPDESTNLEFTVLRTDSPHVPDGIGCILSTKSSLGSLAEPGCDKATEYINDRKWQCLRASGSRATGSLIHDRRGRAIRHSLCGKTSPEGALEGEQRFERQWVRPPFLVWWAAPVSKWKGTASTLSTNGSCCLPESVVDSQDHDCDIGRKTCYSASYTPVRSHSILHCGNWKPPVNPTASTMGPFTRRKTTSNELPR
jgi:hypothetical protein